MRSHHLAFSLLAVLAACGGDSSSGPNHVANPTPALGGGIHGGAIDGELNVFVIDADSHEPIVDAQVRIEVAAGTPITGTTDATGLFIATDAGLHGGQDITVVAAGYPTSSWLGANGAVVTIPLDSGNQVATPEASAAGTIEGWADLPAPATNHALIAFIGFSLSDKLSDPGNDLAQPAGPGLPANTCVRTPTASPPCAWSLLTRTGPQSHYAIILDVDGKGTTDEADDTRTVIGYALKTGLDLNKGQSSEGEILTMLGDPPVDLTVALPVTPAGLSQLAAIALVHFGHERLPVGVPTLSSAVTTARLPALAGPLAGGSYQVYVDARANDTDKVPSSFSIVRTVDPAGTVDLGTLLALPGDLSATAGTYSFTAVSGADLHTVTFKTPDQKEVWGVAILDGRTSFTLPTLTTGDLSPGPLEMHVSALAIPGLDVGDFDLDDFLDVIAKTSEGFVAFSR